MHARSWLLAAASASLVASLPQAPPSPVNGEDGHMGGIFGMGVAIPSGDGILGSIARTIGHGLIKIIPSLPSIPIDPGWVIYTGSEYPRDKVSLTEFFGPGTGPYPAGFLVDPSLPNHVVYAPKTPPPADLKMPVLLWGNGGCVSSGTAYGLYLKEVASHGYLVIAHGPAGAAPPSVQGDWLLPGPNGQKNAYNIETALSVGISTVQDMLDAQDWVVKGNASKYGNIDIDNFITAGSSCGGLMAYSASYKNPRVKLVGVFNSGVIDETKTPLLKDLTAQIAFLDGGPKAIEYKNTERDYALLNQGQPIYKAALDTGHLGTFFANNGGKYANASIDLFNWVFRNDTAAKERWTNPASPGSLVSQHWNVTYKNVR